MFDEKYVRANLKVDPRQGWQGRTIATNIYKRTWTSLAFALIHQREMERIRWCKFWLVTSTSLKQVCSFVFVYAPCSIWIQLRAMAKQVRACITLRNFVSTFYKIRFYILYIYVSSRRESCERCDVHTSLIYNDRSRSWEWLSFRSVANENAFLSPCYRIVRGVMLFFVIGSKRFYNVYNYHRLF